MTKTQSLQDEVNSMRRRRREKHRRDVEYIKANNPEIANWLTEMTREFGKCQYRVTLKQQETDK